MQRVVFVTNSKHRGFSFDTLPDQVATILNATGTELTGAFQEELAETCGLTCTLIADFLENGKELTFPDYLNMGMSRYVGDFCGFLFPLLERRSIA